MKQRGKVFLSDSVFEGGSITWEVKSGGDTFFTDAITASVRLTDCSSVINLDFDCEEHKHIKKRIDKVDKFIIELTKMKDALLEAEKELAPKKFYY